MGGKERTNAAEGWKIQVGTLEIEEERMGKKEKL